MDNYIEITRDNNSLKMFVDQSPFVLVCNIRDMGLENIDQMILDRS